MTFHSFVLLLWFSGSPITVVPDFMTEAACISAGEAFVNKAQRDRDVEPRFLCIDRPMMTDK